MGFTNQSYPIAEVAISLESPQSGDAENRRIGDIIAVRREHFVVGSKEVKGFLWLRIEGLEENEIFLLARRLFEPADDDDGIRYEKRRFCIPLARIKELYPGFDINRALDTNDIYQPFLSVDEDNYRFLTNEKPFQISGLVYDKVIGDYL